MSNNINRTFNHQFRRANRLFAVILLSAVVVTPALSQKTFFISESTQFNGNGCQNTNLNTITASLCDALVASGWTGPRYIEADAWPQDFYEASFGIGGLDDQTGDNHLLSVYAGHGYINNLQFAFPRNGQCNVNITRQMRLGTLSGDRAAYMMYLTSCTMNLSGLSNLWNNEVHQQFGYHNSPSIKDNQPRDFFNQTSSSSNKNAWLSAMEDRPGWFTGDNSPIILTFGLDSNDAAFKHNNAMLKAGSWLHPSPEPWGYFFWTLRDHGGC